MRKKNEVVDRVWLHGARLFVSPRGTWMRCGGIPLWTESFHAFISSDALMCASQLEEKHVSLHLTKAVARLDLDACDFEKPLCALRWKESRNERNPWLPNSVPVILIAVSEMANPISASAFFAISWQTEAKRKCHRLSPSRIPIPIFIIWSLTLIKLRNEK